LEKRLTYNLIERLFDIARDDKDVSGIAKIEFFVNIDTAVEPIPIIKCRDAPHSLRAEPCSRPVCRGGVEGCADKCCFELRDLADILAVGSLHECVDAGKCRLMPSAEERDAAIHDGIRGF
jgi:hypothetical protein